MMASKQSTDFTGNIYVHQWLRNQPTDSSKYRDFPTIVHTDDVSVITRQDASKVEDHYSGIQFVGGSCAPPTRNVKAQQTIDEHLRNGQRHIPPAHLSQGQARKLPCPRHRLEHVPVATSKGTTFENQAVQLTCSTTKATAPTLKARQNHDTIESLEPSSAPEALGIVEKRYQKQPRRKTKEGKYEPKKQSSVKRSQSIRSQVATQKRLKSGAALDQEFSAPNIKSARVTLQRAGPGFFNKGKSSDTVHGRDLPDLTFTNTNPLGPPRCLGFNDRVAARERRKADKGNARSQRLGLETVPAVQNTDRNSARGVGLTSNQSRVEGDARGLIPSLRSSEVDVASGNSSWPALCTGMQNDSIQQSTIDTASKCRQRFTEDSARASSVTWSSSPLRCRSQEPELNRTQSRNIRSDKLRSQTRLEKDDHRRPKCTVVSPITKPCRNSDRAIYSNTPTWTQGSGAEDVLLKLKPVLSLEDLKTLADDAGRENGINCSLQKSSNTTREEPGRTDRFAETWIAPCFERHAKGNTSLGMPSPDSSVEISKLQHDFVPVFHLDHDKFADLGTELRPSQPLTGSREPQRSHMYAKKGARRAWSMTRSQNSDFDAFDIALLQQTRFDENKPIDSPDRLIDSKGTFVENDYSKFLVNSRRGQNKASMHGPPQSAQSSQSSHAKAGIVFQMTAKDACHAKNPPQLLRPSLCEPNNTDHFLLFGQPHFVS